MKKYLNTVLISLSLFVSDAMAHTGHPEHVENASGSGNSTLVSLMSGYPDSTIFVAVAELGIGLLLLAVAVLHFKKTN
jgi:hypothetical protein